MNKNMFCLKTISIKDKIRGVKSGSLNSGSLLFFYGFSQSLLLLSKIVKNKENFSPPPIDNTFCIESKILIMHS